MEIVNGRYRGVIVSRNTRKSKDGNSEFIDIGLGAEQFFDPTTGGWGPLGDHDQLIEGSYFIRSQGEVNVPALRAFASASGWDLTPEQFNDERWVPKKIQVRLKLKAKTDGKGYWYTFTDVVPFNSTSWGKGSASLTETLDEFRKITGDPTPPPYVPPPIVDPSIEVSF